MADVNDGQSNGGGPHVSTDGGLIDDVSGEANGGQGISDVDDSVLTSSLVDSLEVSTIVRSAFDRESSESVLASLRNIVLEKEREVADITKEHYEDFVRSVDELRLVKRYAVELRRQVEDFDACMQRSGRQLLAAIEEESRLHRASARIDGEMDYLFSGMEICKTLLRVQEQLRDNQLYAALRTVRSLRRLAGNDLPPWVKSWAKGLVSPAENEVEKVALQHFKEWLVHVREAQDQVGKVAIKTWSELEDTEMQDQSEIKVKDPLQLVDFTPIHRCAQVYSVLGRLNELKMAYERDRTLQLRMCLPFPSNTSFNLGYQKYISRIVGFFAVESRVLRTAQAVISLQHVQSRWDEASFALRNILESQVENVDSMTVLRAASSYLHHTIVAVERIGLQTGQLLSSFESVDRRLRSIVIKSSSQKVYLAIESDLFTPLTLETEDEWNALVVEAEIDVVDKPSSFPTVAHFSASVPIIAHVVRQAAKDCRNYLGTAKEFASAVSGQGTIEKETLSLMNEVLIECIIKPLTFRLQGELTLSQSIQMTENVNCLEKVTSTAFGSEVSQSMGDLKTITNAMIVDKVKKKLLGFLRDALPDSLMPDQPDDKPSQYIIDMIQFLSSVLAAAGVASSDGIVKTLRLAALEHIPDGILVALSGDIIKRWNMFGLTSLDADLRFLEEWGAAQGVRTFPDSCVGLRQTIELFKSNHPEDILDISKRKELYDKVSLSRLAAIIDTYRDPGTLALFQNKMGEKNFPRLRDLQNLARNINTTSHHP